LLIAGWSVKMSIMPVIETPAEKREVSAFPPWLELPPGYIVNDWIRWQKGKLVAQRLREKPERIALGIRWLEGRGDRLSAHDAEWLNMLRTLSVEAVAELLESAGDKGQRLRSGMPFKGEPFVSEAEMEAIRERAFAGRL
jgi:hypothetical protein